MGQNIVQKIMKSHILTGDMAPGQEISIGIDQTLTQDATGTMAYLQFEAMGVPRVKTKLSVSYIDHNTLQTGFENADDHRFLQTVAAKYGIYFSRPGNGICHQVHLERFGVPGMTLLGSDSHTPTAGGLGMIAIGAGGLDVAVAMGGGPFYLHMPKVVNVKLTGQLNPWVSAKDIILELLRIMTVKGGVGKIIEYSGEGVKTLTVPERATITNMGAELGATTSVFPSDDITRAFLKAQKREDAWSAIAADSDAVYDETIEIDLSGLEPMVAQPHSPDNVARVSQVGAIPVQQVVIGSCTNSSYTDLMGVARILKGRKVHPSVSLSISPGSRQVFEMLARNGALADIISAGARILETACGPCIGMGQSPSSEAVTVRTFNRNFEGRSGTVDAKVYLASPEVAAATAVTGVLTDPKQLGEFTKIKMPGEFLIDDSMIIPPEENTAKVKVIRGPNIKPLPVNKKLPGTLKGLTLLKLGDNITTDHIMPAGAKILPLRSNIPAISQFVFSGIDLSFPDRAVDSGGGFVIGGQNYGQGSSREHAALAPMYLGIKAIMAKSFARIHRANLINFGILPLTFVNEKDYETITEDDTLEIGTTNLNKETELTVKNTTNGTEFKVRHDLTPRQIKIVKAGGLLNYTKQHSS
ncbi:MAG: aconitate hydratase [Firmicutes bacterium HGW-Firmicutes-8]|nr:MAG: aconitate hydratase [Firmicutes bacterium HGW-Firmicutes-8]